MRKRKDRPRKSLVHSNRRLARELWGNDVERRLLRVLRDLADRFNLSIARGEVQLLNGSWYVTHAGLLRVASDKGCAGIRVQPIREYCRHDAKSWVFRAVVYKFRGSKGFVGYGDADPSNVSPLVRGAEMRVAETRAVNRALRKAYGIGLCSVEELRYLTSSSEPAKSAVTSAHSNGNGSGNGQPRLRDRLCLLIRQHQLDPTLVKRYAADFCGTQELKEASRDLVESFISHLAEWSVKDRAGLLCKLNSFAQSQEVQS
jgi:hypothetical protein